MNIYYLGQALNLSGLYMIAALGASIAIKSGEFNLGGEAQIYAGGFCAAVILAEFSKAPSVLALPLAFLASFLISALIALFSAVLKKYKNADFLFTSFIVSAALTPFIDALISGPCRGKTGNLLATEFIQSRYRLSSLMPPSTFNISFIIAVILCVAFYFLLTRTAIGRQLCIYGISNEFSMYAGISRDKISYFAAGISGGMHGLCGALTVCGTYFACHIGFSSGMGWNALTASLLAANNPLLIIPSSLFMGFITTYSNRFALNHNFGFDISGLIQAVILFIVAFPFFRQFKLPVFKGGKVK